MKCLFCIVMIALVLSAPAQQSKLNFAEIDYKVSGITANDPALLSKQLTAFCSTDAQKVRAIFRWITENIDYRTRNSRIETRRKKLVYEEPNDSAELKPLDERVAETVLANKLAVCDGYARLFKTLCNFAGIQAEVVTGYARTEASKKIQRFRANHSWNAVMIDSAWHLLDVTWASGYITWQGDNYVRFFDEQYYLASPEQFIREHYPDDLRWTLMPDPPLMAEFRSSPYKQKSFTKYKITDYKPQRGIIEANLGDTLHIDLQTSDYLYDDQISADPFLDKSIYNSPIATLLLPENKGPFVHYSYIVNSPTVQWLYILYHEDLVLRYRLSIRTPSLSSKLEINKRTAALLADD